MRHISNGTAIPRVVEAGITRTEPEQPRRDETRAQDTTLLDLVKAVSDQARSEAEVIATIVSLVNSGRVRLCGTFRDARFDLRELVAGPTAA